MRLGYDVWKLCSPPPEKNPADAHGVHVLFDVLTKIKNKNISSNSSWGMSLIEQSRFHHYQNTALFSISCIESPVAGLICFLQERQTDVLAQDASAGQQPCTFQSTSNDAVDNALLAQLASMLLRSIFENGSEYFQLPSLFSEVEQNVKINVDVVCAIVGQRFTLESYIIFCIDPVRS